MSNIKDLTGIKFGRLTVISLSTEDRSKYVIRSPLWLCKCDCGNIVSILGNNLRSGATKSCGCLNKEKSTTHGMYGISEYRIWQGMIQRCCNFKDTNYHNYGGRGITVTESWKTFENFYDDMGPKPGPEYSIERINNDGNYEPGNCKWATKEEQGNNRRNNVLLEYKGEKLNISQMARRHNLNLSSFYSRLSKGLSVDEAINKPFIINKR